ncbi:MAG: hypothetical protein ABR991_01665, partial [Terracidiphilus sp.]
MIDEFGETQGTLLSDTFVQVNVPANTNQNANFTDSGNMNGTVNTSMYAVQINADPTPFVYPSNTPPTPTTEIFDRWVTGPGGTVTTSSLLEPGSG